MYLFLLVYSQLNVEAIFINFISIVTQLRRGLIVMFGLIIICSIVKLQNFVDSLFTIIELFQSIADNSVQQIRGKRANPRIFVSSQNIPYYIIFFTVFHHFSVCKFPTGWP